MPRILLIDDSPGTEALLRALLECEGHVVTAADNAASGIEMARADPPDIILIALSLHGSPAWKSIREMKRDPRLSDIPVIALTTATMGAERERALAAGSDGFVPKPIEGDALKRVLSASLEKAAADKAALTRPLATGAPIVRELVTLPAGERRILLVEDDENSRYGLKSLLEIEGYAVEEAATAAEARRILARKSYDAVFMDISLPDADGTRLIQEIRRRPENRELPIIALTGKTADEDRRLIEEAGATSYLSKPVNVKAMLRMLARLTVRSLSPGKPSGC